MTERTDIERLLRAHYAARVSSAATDDRLASLLARTSTTRPRAAWLARLGGDGLGTALRPGLRREPLLVWVVLIAVLALVVAAGTVLLTGGPRLFGIVAVPSPSASPEPSLEVLPSATPDASPAEESLSVQASASPVSSPAASPGPSGIPVASGPTMLAFVERPVGPWSPGQAELLVADPNGQDARVIVSGIDGGGDWSPSGKYLTAVRSTVDVQGTIAIIDPTGREYGRIDEGENADFKWSPTADVIAVVSQSRSGVRIRTYRPDGSQIRRLIAPDGVTTVVNGIDWSPEGRKLVIAGCIGCQDNKYDDTPNLTWDLWTVDARGGQPRRLTHSPVDIETGPAWSPDGSTIAYTTAGWCNPNTGSCAAPNIWRINADGTGHQLLVANASGPVWSPDGSLIAYSPQPDNANDLDVYVANADGSGQRRVTTMAGQDSMLAWSRDGSRLLFLHVEPGDLNTDRPQSIWSINADGSDPVKLADNASSSGWRPTP